MPPTPEEVIKKCALDAGAKVVGIASVDAINEYAPPGYQPSDLLIGARSVVVLGGPVHLKGAYQTIQPRVVGTNKDFNNVGRGASVRIAKLIEKEYGHYSIYDPFGISAGYRPFMSIKLCAELAGLATRSMAAGILLNPQYGLLNFHCVITTMPLAADGPMQEQSCPHPSCVKMWEKKGTTLCLDACPDCLSGELEGDKIKWLDYDRLLCSTRAQTTAARALQKMLLAVIEEQDPEKRKMLAFGSFMTRCLTTAVTSAESTGMCSVCILRCPVCRPNRELKRSEA